MPRFSIFHNNFLTSSEILSWWNPVTFADGSSWSTRWARTTASQQLTKCHAGPCWPKHSVCWIFQSFCANFIGAYSVFLCGTHLLLEAATATTCFYKKPRTNVCIIMWNKHLLYTNTQDTPQWPPPHCESPHSAVALSAAGPAGCGSRSLGQCAGWTGPPDTVTGCRSESHWNTGRKGTDPELYSNYHVSQKTPIT